MTLYFSHRFSAMSDVRCQVSGRACAFGFHLICIAKEGSPRPTRISVTHEATGRKRRSE